jgi:hypothetical protein
VPLCRPALANGLFSRGNSHKPLAARSKASTKRPVWRDSLARLNAPRADALPFLSNHAAREALARNAKGSEGRR